MSNTTKKVTKRENYNTLLDILSRAEQTGMPFDADPSVTYDDLREFVNREIELLDNKAAAAQKRAAEKKQEGDALREEVLNALSETEAMTIDQIVAALDNPEVTRNMVTSRLTQLGDKGTQQVEKEMVSVAAGEGKSRKVAAYRRKA